MTQAVLSAVLRPRAVWAWAYQRAWSRAGAMAVELERSRTAQAIGYSARMTLHLMGCVTIAAAVAVMLWNDFGPGPLDVFVGGVRSVTGLPLALAIYLVLASLLALSWALGRRPGIGNLVTTGVIGPTMQMIHSAIEDVPHNGTLWMSVPVHLAAIGTIALGAGAMLTANVGAGTAELLTLAASDQTGQPQPRIRFALEMSWLVVGWLLGGPVGAGTVIVAIGIGPAVGWGYRVVNAGVSSTVSSTRRKLYLAAG